MIEKGVALDHKNAEGKTALDIAESIKDEVMIEVIKEAQRNIEMKKKHPHFLQKVAL